MTSPSDRDRPFSPLAGIAMDAMLTPSTPKQQAPSAPPRETLAGQTMTETTLRTRIHPDDKRRFESMCVRLSESLGVTVRPTNLLRALLVLAHRVEPSLHNKARHTHGLVRPRNDDRKGTAEFERRLSEVLAAAIDEASRMFHRR
jgi:hypothetical protein